MKHLIYWALYEMPAVLALLIICSLILMFIVILAISFAKLGPLITLSGLLMIVVVTTILTYLIMKDE